MSATLLEYSVHEIEQVMRAVVQLVKLLLSLTAIVMPSQVSLLSISNSETEWRVSV